MSDYRTTSLGRTTDLAIGQLNTPEDLATLRTHVEAVRVQAVLDREEGLTPLACAHLDAALAQLAQAVAQLDLATYSARARG